MGPTRLKSRRQNDPGSKWARILIAILSTVGVIDTGSITLTKWGWIGVLTCPGGTDGCNTVINSAWGVLFEGNNFSIPLSLAGFFGYLAILTISLIQFFPGISENKLGLSKRSWWGLFFLSCSMAIFSLVLLSIMIWKIKAFCLFCIISAIISITILALTIIGGNWDEPGELIFRGIIISLIVILGSLIWSSSVDPNRKELTQIELNSPPIIKTKSTDSAIELAEYLKEKGAVMYFAYWCHYCALQKELFGKEASARLKLVECAEDGKNNQRQLCEEKGIMQYPSWEINGKITSGALPLEEIADISGYKGSRDF